MALPGEDDGERSGDVRSPKRQRIPNILNEDDEDEHDEDFIPPSVEDEEEEEEEEFAEETEDEFAEETEEEEEEESAQEEVEEDVTVTRMATIGNDFEDVITEGESPKSSQSVKLQSSDVLDCPTCCEPLQRPIYQCNNGHLACSSCCKKLNNRCSFCRSHIGDIRCRAMEKIIEATIVSCSNAKYGCKESTVYGNQSSHKGVCAFVPCYCPVQRCNYVGSYTDLKSHAHNVHLSDYKHDLIAFVFDRSFIFCLNLGKENMVVFKEEKEGDLIVVQAFKKPEGVYVTVNHIAPLAPGIRNFSCNLAKLNQNSTLRMGFMVSKIQRLTEELSLEGGDMLIPSKMLSGNHWKMQICFGKEGKYTHI